MTSTLRGLALPPTPQQKVLLDTIGSVFLQHGRWPAWAWVEEELERQDMDANAVLSSMPHEPTHGYGFVSPGRVRAPRPDFQLYLTIAGLHHVESASELVADHLALVSLLGSIRAQVALDPFDTERPRVTMKQVANAWFRDKGRPPAPINPSRLEFLSREPATWHCQLVDGSSPDWVIELSPIIRRFAGVSDVDDYLERLERILVVDAATDSGQVHTSPFTLPAALDYLDTVWRLKFGTGLLVPPGLERSARLALDAGTAEEVDSALSALSEVLKALNVPGQAGVGGHPLVRLVPFLRTHLAEEVMPRVEAAVAIFDAARQVRASAQHVGAQARGIAALTGLGLEYPVADWPSAWRQSQQAVAHACDVMRQEVHATL